jgi:hypothetical protein
MEKMSEDVMATSSPWLLRKQPEIGERDIVWHHAAVSCAYEVARLYLGHRLFTQADGVDGVFFCGKETCYPHFKEVCKKAA